MRVALFAYHDMGATALEVLLDQGDEVPLLVTHRDDLHEGLWFRTPAEVAARRGGVERQVYREDVRPGDLADLVRAARPDLVLSVYYRKLLPMAVVRAARLGGLNLHGSLLPRLRGCAPLNWALALGEARTGVTLHHMVADPDAGDIVAQRAVEIAPRESAPTLHDKLVAAARALLEETLPLVRAGRAPRTPQVARDATYRGRRRPEDGRIEPTSTVAAADRLVRAVTAPWPGAFFARPRGPHLYVWAAHPGAPAPGAAAPPGALRRRPDGELALGLADGELVLDWISEGDGPVRAGRDLRLEETTTMTTTTATQLPPAAHGARRAEFLPFSRPTIEQDEIDEVVDSLRSGWITTGPKVAKFEAQLAARLDAPHAVAVSSATAGLHLALAALGVGPGDEVIVPSITWCSTANVVELLGATTVLADVDPDTLCMSPEEAARRVTPRTKAIVPVHFGGQPVDLDGFRALSAELGLHLIEDAAHALGTCYRGVEVGASGGLVVFSFHAIKNVTTGEGGMVVVRDEALAERLRLLRFHGVSKDAWRRYHKGGTAQYEVLLPGWKYNMMDLQAALGLRQLGKLDRFNERRRALAARYDALLADLPEVRPLGQVPWPSLHAMHLYVVRLDLSALRLDRDEVMQALQQENIGTGLHFPALHVQPYYREKYGLRPADLPHAELAGRSILSLPLYPTLRDEDQDDVVAALRRVLAGGRK